MIMTIIAIELAVLIVLSILNLKTLKGGMNVTIIKHYHKDKDGSVDIKIP